MLAKKSYCLLLAFGLIIIVIAGCATEKVKKVTKEPREQVKIAKYKKSPGNPLIPSTGMILEESIPEATSSKKEDNPSKPQASPQTLVAIRLVEEADRRLMEGNIDQAIGLYEQAVQLDPYNGSAFLGLAQAWSFSGAYERALEFAKKAEILLQDNLKRLKDVLLLEASIYDKLNNPTLADYYRRKAARLLTF